MIILKNASIFIVNLPHGIGSKACSAKKKTYESIKSIKEVPCDAKEAPSAFITMQSHNNYT